MSTGNDDSRAMRDVDIRRLEISKVNISKRVGSFALSTLRIDQRQDPLGDVLYDMSMKLVSEALRPRKAAEYTLRVYVPSSWWQHFKQTCFPVWLQNLFPVRQAMLTQTVSARVRAVYPQCQYVMHPNGEPPVVVLSLDVGEKVQTGECDVELTVRCEEKEIR